MKPRKPLKRTALKRSTKPLKRSYIKSKPHDPEAKKKRVKAKREREKQSVYSAYWRDRATLMWGDIVRKRAGGRCEFTGKLVGEERLEAHHVVRRGIYSCRTDLKNGMAIEKRNHQGRDDGPHGSREDKWWIWVEANRPELYVYWLVHKSDQPDERIDWKAEHDRLSKIYKEM